MPKKVGRPSQFNKKIQDRIKALALKGFTDKEICKAIDVPERTFNNWKKKYHDFWQSLKDWKAEADAKVERSLYERAQGYSHPEDKIFCNNGEIIVQPTIKHYPPDPTSMIFWLKNRQPEKWRDKQEMNISGNLDITVIDKWPNENNDPS